MSVSIYHPSIKREAEMFGITELQAYRKVNARVIIQERIRHHNLTCIREALRGILD